MNNPPHLIEKYYRQLEIQSIHLEGALVEGLVTSYDAWYHGPEFGYRGTGINSTWFFSLQMDTTVLLL